MGGQLVGSDDPPQQREPPARDVGVVEASAGKRGAVGDIAGLAELHERQTGEGPGQSDTGDGAGDDGQALGDRGITGSEDISDSM